MIAFLLCILAVQACGPNPKVKNYFMPKGFEGNVAVIYSNAHHQSDVYNYYIPENGILKTDYGFFEGNYRINFYQKNDVNGYDTLYEELPSKVYDSSKNRIYFNRVLTFQRLNSDTIYTVGTFYVGKKQALDLEKDRFLFEKRLEKMLLGN